MLGNLAEVLFALGMLLTIPASLALVVVAARSFARPPGAEPIVRGGPLAQVAARTWVHLLLSMLAGAAASFLLLESYFGVVLTAGAVTVILREGGVRRWLAAGGFLVGMGACTVAMLSQALTNHDPAVTYDPSTIPVFWVGAGVALAGALTIAVAAATGRHRTA